MTGEEQRIHCEVCEFHKTIHCFGGIKIMSCHYGDYKNHPVWGNFECLLGENKPTRKEEDDNLF